MRLFASYYFHNKVSTLGLTYPHNWVNDVLATHTLLVYRHAAARQRAHRKAGEEIAQIREANRLFLQGGKKKLGAAYHKFSPRRAS